MIKDNIIKLGRKTFVGIVPIIFVGIFLCAKPAVKNIFVESSKYKEPSTPPNSAFTDMEFYKCVVDRYNYINETDLEYDVSLTDAQLASIESLTCGGRYYGEITNTSGIEKLTGLKSLTLVNNNFSTIDLSYNTQLTYLNLGEYENYSYNGNNITSINLSNNAELKELHLEGNDIENLNLSNNLKLEALYASSNEFTELDLSHNTLLKRIRLISSKLTTIDLTHNALLEELDLSDTLIESIDLSQNVALKKLDIGGAWNTRKVYKKSDSILTTIDLSHNTLLEELDLSSNDLSTIDLQYNTALKKLDLSTNNLSSIDLSYNSELVELVLDNVTVDSETNKNHLTSINLEDNSKLEVLNLSNNEISTIDLSHNTALKKLNLSDNKLTGIDLRNNSELVYLYIGSKFSNHNSFSTLDLSHNTLLESLDLHNIGLTSIDLSQNTSLKYLDLGSGSDGTNANSFSTIDLSNNTLLEEVDLADLGLTSINLNNVVNLKELTLTRNNLTSIDLSHNVALESLNASGNNLSSIDLSHNSKIEELVLADNGLSSIDLSHNVALESLNASGNNLSSIDLSHNSELDKLLLSHNNLTSIDLSSCEGMWMDLDLSYNNLSSIDLSHNPYLGGANLSHNSISSIDLSHNPNMSTLNLSNNNLVSLDLSNNAEISSVNVLDQSTQIKLYSNNLSGIDSKIYNLVNENGIQDSYLSTVDITGYETNNNSLTYNVQWVTAQSSNNNYDLSSDTIGVDVDSISEFLSSFSCSNSNNCSFVVNDGTNDLQSGTFENKDYTLKVIESNELLKEYNLVFVARSVSLNSSNLRLDLTSNTSYQLSATVVPNNALDKTVSWVSSDSSVATVDNGLVSVVGVGETVITASTSNGRTATCNVIVTESPVYGVTYRWGTGEYEAATYYYSEGVNVVSSFDVSDMLYMQGKKLIGWTYNNQTYGLSDELLMPTSDIELIAAWENISDGLNSNYQVETISTTNKVLKGVPLNTDVSNLNLDLSNEYTITLFKSDNTTVKTSGKIGTGDIIKVYVGSKLVDKYTISVKGDTNGDGEVSVSDISMIYKNIKKKSEFSDAQSIASDVNDDGGISVSDISILYKYLKRKINLL